MKKMIVFTFLFIFSLMLVACSKKEGQLTRIDVQKTNDTNEEVIITDTETIHIIKDSFEKVNWEPNTKAEMARKEDLLVTLFYTFDKNMPEKLYKYRIWFNPDDTATIISEYEKEGYGKLGKEHSKVLKSSLLK